MNALHTDTNCDNRGSKAPKGNLKRQPSDDSIETPLTVSVPWDPTTEYEVKLRAPWDPETEYKLVWAKRSLWSRRIEHLQQSSKELDALCKANKEEDSESDSETWLMDGSQSVAAQAT